MELGWRGVVIQSVTFENILWMTSILGYAALALRLRLTGLHARYRWLFLYCVFVALRGPILAQFPRGKNTYAEFWMVTEAIALVLYFLIVADGFHLIFRSFPAISTWSRWILWIIVPIAIVVTCASLLFDAVREGRQFPILAGFLVAERALVTVLFIFQFLLTICVALFPVPIGRNVVMYSLLFTVYFFCKAAFVFLLNMSGWDWISIVNNALLAVSIGVVGVWLVVLNRAGETQEVRVTEPWDEQQAERILGALHRLNATLTPSRAK